MSKAVTLGVNKWKIFWTIEVQLLLPTIQCVHIGVYHFVSQYAITAIIGGGNVVTLALVYYPFSKL
ncbi:hypothetical protein KHA80_22760 [Anaerobacillus sp. HL2]|nr:hypothetical protein KHA80_22760 [Anaerobacillus sp. HL2]